MIATAGTFEYEAEFTFDSWVDRDIELTGVSLAPANTPQLVGPKTKIRFWNEHLVLVALDKESSYARNVSVPVGDAVNLAAQPGDRLYVARTGSGGIGLSILRKENLILALGALTAVPLGRDIKINRGANPDYQEQYSLIWLDLDVRNERLELRGREVIETEGYQVYVERCWLPTIPGVDECVSLCVEDSAGLKLAAIRSAILLGQGTLKITKWDGREVHTKISDGK
jgi:hypothetical protein